METGCWWSLHNWYKLCHFNFSARRYQILTFSFHTFSICHNIWFLCTFLYFCLFACGPFSRCTQSPGHTINLFCRKLERGSQKNGLNFASPNYLRRKTQYLSFASYKDEFGNQISFPGKRWRCKTFEEIIANLTNILLKVCFTGSTASSFNETNRKMDVSKCFTSIFFFSFNNYLENIFILSSATHVSDIFE